MVDLQSRSVAGVRAVSPLSFCHRMTWWRFAWLPRFIERVGRQNAKAQIQKASPNSCEENVNIFPLLVDLVALGVHDAFGFAIPRRLAHRSGQAGPCGGPILFKDAFC